MFNVTKKELDWGGRPLTLETGRMARQADGAVLATYGETAVLATVVASREPRPEVDFLPLTVNYQEKYFAAGKIPGGFFKREARPTEKEVLTSRLIDRPIRPLFANGYRCETQLIATVLSHDLENDPDIVAMVACSAALAVANLPFAGPIGGARVGFQDGEYVLNPVMPESAGEGTLDLVVAGTGDAVMMVESEATELTEEQMLGAVMFGHQQMQPVIAMIAELAAEVGNEPRAHSAPDHEALMERVRALAEAGFREAAAITEKPARRAKLAELRQAAIAALEADEDATPAALADCFKSLEKDVVRTSLLDTGTRLDGRDLVTVRPITCTVGELPRPHGSALFTRGETQALVVTTLGTGEDSQIMDTLHANYRERFLLHYNFPPFSVGEARRMIPPGRREIGHGKLAWRALRAVLPAAEEFPYTIRMVAEILESNGSSSMATVCGSSLSMMDAGVPLRRAVAGIAMGLILEGDRHAVLTDILGDEDHLGDMDFKVAGTDQGVTALQMDIKVAGITEEIMRTALAQAREARLHILDEMAKAISEGRAEFSPHAPRIEVVTIPTDRIRDVIGTGGKVIRSIVEETGAKVDVGDDGVIKIASPDAERIEAAKKRIHEITADAEPNTVYDGTVVKLMDFGAFVNFFGPKDGLVHVSQMANRRVGSPSEVVAEGDKVKVLFMGVDERGRAKLSMKAVNQETGERLSNGAAERQPESASSPEPEAGTVHNGTVTRVMDFGVIVNIGGGRDGLVHISQMANRRIATPTEIADEGDRVKVLFMGMDDRGRTKLSMKAVDQETGKRIDDGPDDRYGEDDRTPEPRIGQVYDGTVTRVMDFGVIVNVGGRHDGLVHISEMANRRIGTPTEIADEGDRVKVLLLDRDDRGRNKFSMKAVNQQTGQREQGGDRHYADHHDDDEDFGEPVSRPRRGHRPGKRSRRPGHSSY